MESYISKKNLLLFFFGFILLFQNYHAKASDYVEEAEYIESFDHPNSAFSLVYPSYKENPVSALGIVYPNGSSNQIPFNNQMPGQQNYQVPFQQPPQQPIQQQQYYQQRQQQQQPLLQQNVPSTHMAPAPLTQPATRSYSSSFLNKAPTEVAPSTQGKEGQAKSYAQMLEEKKKSQEFSDNEHHDYAVRRSGGWREHPIALSTQEQFNSLPKSERDHIEHAVASYCDKEEHKFHSESNKHKCREKQTATMVRHAHVENHIENNFKSDTELHKKQYARSIMQSRSHMALGLNSLHDHSLKEMCEHVKDAVKRDQCEKEHSSNLKEMDGKSFGVQPQNPKVLSSVKKHMGKSAPHVPFFHGDHKEMSTKGGANGLLGSSLKGLF